MAVKMLKSTRFEGARTIGEIYTDLSKDVENRWIKNGIAELAEVEVEVEVEVEEACKDGNCELPELQDLTVAEEEEDEDTEEYSDDEVKLTDLSAKQLFKRCKDRGLDVRPKMSREYYIEVLEK